jgi:stage V sporulation protein R
VVAYLLASNNFVDQKLVMAHVCGHADFFKNNFWFAHTNRRMLDEMANHATRINRYVSKYGMDAVENFLDACLSLENLIDVHAAGIRRRPEVVFGFDEEEEEALVRKIPAKHYMDSYINPPEFLAEEQRKLEDAKERRKHFPEEPERDILLFLLEHAPLENWQRDVLDIVREEAYYFAPQGQTKVMNEGWACAAGDTLVKTDWGMLRLQDIVDKRLAVNVCDGERLRRVYDYASLGVKDTVRIVTRRGLVLEGARTHRVIRANGQWTRVDELQPGDKVKVAPGTRIWAMAELPVDWSSPQRLTLQAVADNLGVNVTTLMRRKRGRNVLQVEAIDTALAEYDQQVADVGLIQPTRRKPLTLPLTINQALGEFLGLLVGDGHVSEVKRVIGLTSGDLSQAQRFLDLAKQLFGLDGALSKDGGRYRANLYSQELEAFLLSLGIHSGPAASKKAIPYCILQSPEPVVAAFLRGLFDADGYAGEQGVILSSSSEQMGRSVQEVLLNFGILSRRRRQQDGCWHVHIAGESAARFADLIGFSLDRKQEALRVYVQNRRWFKAESWDDEIAEISYDQREVYDISVEETHRYAAAGLLNHNSYWHSTLMTQKIMEPNELIDYAEHNAGTLATSPGRLNPYKLGVELFRDIEDRWNRGAFGAEYEACGNMEARRQWDKKLGLGREKIFEVRRIYNDIGFIDAFLTEDFAREHKLFTFAFNEYTEQYEIASRHFEEIKRRLLFQLTNFGQPIIEIVDANYNNRGELYLMHRYEGIEMDVPYAEDTLKNLFTVWGRPVHLETELEGEGRVLFSHNMNGGEHRII